MNFRRCFVGIFALLLIASSATLFAATQNAVLYGSVYDSAGNPLAGVTVTLENAAIGFSKSADTGPDGSYNFPEVPPAEDYILSASRGATKIDSRAGIVVNVGDERVILPPLKEQAAVVAAGPNPETAPKVVQAAAVTTETVSTAISGVITGDQLRSLPVAINRNFLNAGVIPPSTHDVQAGSSLMGASFSVSGNRPQTNNFLLDGADNVASSTNQAVPFQVNDSVQEFRVTSGTANAEYGRNSGGTVNIVTKRATNGFHGNVFGYFNNDALNSSSPVSVYSGSTFDKAAAYAGPVNSNFFGLFPLTYNDYVAASKGLGFCTDSIATAPGAGLSPCTATNFSNAVFGEPLQYGKNTFFDPASVLGSNNSFNIPFDSKQFGANGGAAIIKDKLFAFGSYEGTRIDNPNPIFERVPSSFDRTLNPYGSPLIGFSNNLSDPLCPIFQGCTSYNLDQNILGLYPTSNVVGVPGVLEFFRGQAPNYTNVHNGLFRSDYVYSQKTDLSARYVVQDLDQLHDDTLPEQAQYPGNGILRHALNQNLSLTYSHTFNSTWVTDARLGFNRFGLRETPQDASFDAASLGLPNHLLPTILLSGLDSQYSGATTGVNGAFAGWSDLFLANQTFGTLPTLDGLFPFARLGAPLGAPTDRRDTTVFLADNTSWSYGKHGIKFGWEVRHLDNRLTDDSFARGFMYSGNIGEFTHDSETCNEECAHLFGNDPLFSNAFLRPSFDFYQQQSTLYQTRLHSYALGGYIQDTWHIHPRVTLNYGLRWEYFSPPQDKNDALYNFDPASNGLVQEDHTGVVDPYGTACTSTVSGYASIPAALSGQAIFRPGNGGWVCGGGGFNDFNKIVTSDTNNFAPRLGVAWDIFGTGKTVFRAGIGYFYDQLPASYVSQLMYNRPTTTPNALFGTFSRALGTSPCPFSVFVTCGVGSAIVNPGVQVASTLNGIDPNSTFSSAVQPFAIYARDTANSNTPYSRQISASLQQQLGNHLTAEIGYLGNHGTNLPVLYNQNFANETNLLNAVDGNLSLVPIYTMTNRASSDYNSLLFRLRAASWHGLRVNGTYVWSHSIDNASDGVFPPEPLTLPNLSIAYGLFGQDSPIAACLFLTGACSFNVTIGNQQQVEQFPLTLPSINFSPGAVTTTGAGQVLTSRYLIPQDPFNFLVNDRGNSDFDVRHRAVVDYIWDVPAFSKAWGWPKWMDYWQLSGVFTAQSGQPFSIFAGPVAGEINQRVNVVGPVSISDDPSGAISATGLQLASAGASCATQPALNHLPAGAGQPGFISNFLQPAPGVACTGDSGRNQFVGPNYINTNFAIQKGFPIFGEGHMLTFRTEFYNLFNRANFYNPISQLSLDGQTMNPDFGVIKSAHEPRQIQFAVRYSW